MALRIALVLSSLGLTWLAIRNWRQDRERERWSMSEHWLLRQLRSRS